jgi:hypothetical protein
MSDLFNDRRLTPSERNMRDPEFRALHELGDCKDCGRNEGHKWHKPGEASIGDGQQPHRYNPEGAPFQRTTPS